MINLKQNTSKIHTIYGITDNEKHEDKVDFYEISQICDKIQNPNPEKATLRNQDNMLLKPVMYNNTKSTPRQ